MFFAKRLRGMCRGHLGVFAPLAAVCTLACATAAWGSTAVLLNDTFSDGNIATATGAGEVNGGWWLLENFLGSSTPSLTESEGSAIVATTSTANNAAGIVSMQSFGLADAPNGLRLRFNVASVSQDPSVTGMAFGLKTVPQTFIYPNDTFIVGPNYIAVGLHSTFAAMSTVSHQGVALYTSPYAAPRVYTAQHANPGSVATNADGSWSDGFTVEMTFTPGEWSYEVAGLNNRTTGLPQVFSASGAWAHGFTYDDLLSDFLQDGFHVFSTVQRAGTTVSFSQITLTAIPEPAGISILAGLIGATLLMRHGRRARAAGFAGEN